MSWRDWRFNDDEIVEQAKAICKFLKKEGKMPRGNPIDLGIIQFDTQASCREHFKKMLWNYKLYEQLNETDQALLGRLLLRHPESKEKIGSGIVHFFVAPPPESPSDRCFWLKRADETITDFSYIQCVSGKARPHKQQVMSALRKVVAEDIYDAKSKVFNKLKNEEGKIICPLTGEWLSWSEIHADHQPPMTFEVIVHTFMQVNRLDWEDIELVPQRDKQSIVRIVNKPLVEDFKDFHNRVADGNIRLISAKKNLSQGGKYRIKKMKEEEHYLRLV